ncbi:hypothetical protein CROQUDRAFT_55525 [Cronartium quercuum f. sp. fusiforme G11]|uniref:Uncharacterized protein n=1 Tax=Cronartium quercuum f. sp. fusiforme G11 TaxID=708437 RepID=A0A9P6T4S0_9BASI|nr:hypothetical protein CROQUDRAFT_55525 [Cronartium quercuum f. sp. fusiforme G11]
MSGRNFNKKYYNHLSLPYQINTPTGDSENEDGDGPAFANRALHKEDMTDSIDLQVPSKGSDEEDNAINKLYYANGDFSNLYDESEEDGDYTPGENEDSDDDQEPPVFDTIGDEQMHEELC